MHPCTAGSWLSRSCPQRWHVINPLMNHPSTRVLTGAARQKLRRLVPTTITMAIIFIICIAVFVVSMSFVQHQNQSDQTWSHRHTELSVPQVSLHWRSDSLSYCSHRQSYIQVNLLLINSWTFSAGRFLLPNNHAKRKEAQTRPKADLSVNLPDKVTPIVWADISETPYRWSNLHWIIQSNSSISCVFN